MKQIASPENKRYRFPDIEHMIKAKQFGCNLRPDAGGEMPGAVDGLADVPDITELLPNGPVAEVMVKKIFFTRGAV